MKKIGFMIVYNDVDYLDHTLTSFKDFVDEMIIVEGAFEITTKGGNPSRSDDGTLDILSKHVDNKKIFLKHVNLREHKDHYDIGYQWALERNADWAIMVDSDEIWTEQMKNIVDVTLKKQSTKTLDIKEIRLHEYCFINDFKTWYPGVYPRIFKAEKDAFFVFDNEVQFKNGRGQHNYLVLGDSFKNFHYGYVRNNKRWKLKQDCMWEKDFNPINLQYKLDGDKYIIPSDIPIYNFTGQHPDIMKNHKFYNMSASDIIYGVK